MGANFDEEASVWQWAEGVYRRLNFNEGTHVARWARRIETGFDEAPIEMSYGGSYAFYEHYEGLGELSELMYWGLLKAITVPSTQTLNAELLGKIGELKKRRSINFLGDIRKTNVIDLYEEAIAYEFEYIGHWQVRYELGNAYYDGIRIERNYKEARRWYKLGIGKNDYTLGGDIDPTKFCDKRIINNPLEGEVRYRLGEIYYYGRDVSEDRVEAARWYKLAASYNHAEAQYSLGHLYAYGEGVRKDWSLAEGWYAWASRNGCQKATDSLVRHQEVERKKKESNCVVC